MSDEIRMTLLERSTNSLIEELLMWRGLAAEHLDRIAELEAKIAEPAKRPNNEEFADMLDSYCNNFSTDFRQGVEIGKKLQTHHRTIQATVFRFIIGIAVGIGKDVQPNRMDARNEQAVICSQQIADMIADDHLVLGSMV